MADVSGKFFSAKKVRTGVSPSSPGVEQGETLPPVNPPGSDLNSVGLSMPSAFNVANSPLTSNGTIAVTGAGTTAQYVRGDGSLASFPSLTGYVPYTGATQNVDLGEFGLDTGFVNLDTTPTNTPTTQGTMYWDDSRSTAALIMNGTLQHIGQDTFFYVKNSTGSSIAKGTAVRFDGTDGASGHLLIAPFLANGTYPSNYFMGVTAETIANGSFGQVMHFGELGGINTSGYTAGALLYASTTVAGGFQTTAPVAPNNIVLIAAAINSKNNGEILVRPTYGSNINQDEGVKIVSPTTGQLLQLQSNGLWENKTKAQVLGGTSSQFVKGDGSLDSTTYQSTAEKGQPNGYASLDGNGKVPLAQINDALIGNVNYQGLWNAATNNPTLVNPPSSGTKGYYYIVSTAGTFASISFEVGDWIISNGSAWQKVDNTDAVSSVFGRTGNVIAANGDYNTSQVTENTNLYFTQARVSANTDVAANTAARHNAVTLGTANGLSLSTQQLSLQLASGSQNGALSSTDWTTFNNKENAITAGTTAQYFRGDKTFQTLNTSVVPESGNLYFTNARAIASVLTGYTSGAGTISAADSILSAIQKLNGNIGALVTGVSSVNGQTGAVTLTTSNIAEGTNLYFTQARVSANTDVAANTAARHNAVTLGTANGLSLNTQQLSLGLASAGVTGALSGTDWSTFNSKQQALNGTGFVKISGTTISYDNSTYLTTAAAASTYLALAGGTMTGNVNWGQTDRGITWGFNTDGASIKFYNTGDGDADSRLEFATIDNNNEYFRWVHIPSGGSLYESMRLVPNSNGNAQLIVSGSIIKSGGTSSQFLKADGSVDSNTYYLASNPSAFIALTALSGTAPIQYNNTTGAISITQASGSTNGFLSSTDWNTFNNKANSVVGGYLPLSGGTMTGVITTPNGTFGIIVGDDSRLADRNIANTLFLEGNQNNDRGYINFSETTGNALGAVNGGDLTWRGNVVWHAGNITPVPTSRTITINGTTLDLSANRTYNVGTVTSVAALTLGTSGTDLSSSVANGTTTPVITLNVPTASATNRGALSAADWTTFNNKQNALTNPVTGTGTTNYLPKFTGTSTIGNSQIFDNGSAVGIGTASVTELLTVNGEISAVTRFRVNPSTQSNQIIGDGNAFSIGGSNNLGIRNDSGSIVFASGGATVQLQLNTSGNLGLAVTPSAWGSDFRVAMQLGGGGSIAGAAGVGGNSPTYIAVGGNYYLNSSAQPIYIASVAASRYEQNAGQHSWSTAPSGTAGNAISFTQAMTLGSNSGLSIGTPSAAPSQGLLVQGVANFSDILTANNGVRSNSLNGFVLRNNANTENLGGLTRRSFWAGGGGLDTQIFAETGYSIFLNPGGSASIGLTLASSGAATFSSSVTAASIIRSGGTSSQYLMADGSVSTLSNPVTGTGSAGQVAYWSSGSAITGESNLFWDATNDRLGIGRNNPSQRLDILGSGTVYANIENSGANIAAVITKNTSKTFTTGLVTDYWAVIDSTSGSNTRLMIESGGNVLINTTTNVTGANLNVNGNIRTAAPTGGSAENWKLGNAVNGTVNANRLIRVEIAGVGYDLVARQII